MKIYSGLKIHNPTWKKQCAIRIVEATDGDGDLEEQW